MTPRTPLLPHRVPTRLLVVTLFAAALLGWATPAGAQYGGTVDLFVDPVRVEIDGSFSYFGSNCPADSTVTITIDGFPGVLDTTVAFADTSYAGFGVAMPAGVIAGQTYTVRASCGGGDATATILAVCNGGTDPVNGECPDGNTTGGEDDPDPNGSTTTTTTPGGPNGPGGGGPDLAVTGASFAELAVQIGVTLSALGAIFILLATKRREEETS